METKHKRARHRSPANPSLTLEAALERASNLRQEENFGWVPPEVAVVHLGYKHTSGHGGEPSRRSGNLASSIARHGVTGPVFG